MRSSTRLSVLPAVLASITILGSDALAAVRPAPSLPRGAAVSVSPENPETRGLFERSRTYSFSGVVQFRSGPGVFYIREDLGFDATIVIPRGTPITRYGAPATIRAIRAGDRICGWAKRPADAYVARSVAIE
ncbi:MAG TPA: hypothetical protein VF551_03505 [Chthoniobacterales bacterium]